MSPKEFFSYFEIYNEEKIEELKTQYTRDRLIYWWIYNTVPEKNKLSLGEFCKSYPFNWEAEEFLKENEAIFNMTPLDWDDIEKEI